jgi:glycosyltransferase involved in cell wall biosynthesis
VPDASLRIYYRFQPWYDQIIQNTSEFAIPMKKRAVLINNSLEKLGRNGENGVTLVGPVPRKTMAQELLATRVFAYTCDPINNFTEGFSCSVLDACAAGCVPIIAAIDALPEIYRGAACLISGNPADEKERWIKTIVAALQDDNFADGIRHPAKAFATGFSRQKIMPRFERLVYERKKGEGPR